MMDIASIIQNVLATARSVSSAIPGLSAVSPLIGVGEKLVGILDDLTDSAPDTRTQEEMQEARRELAARVSAKANATADRLDG
jgi:hypothetical protein